MVQISLCFTGNKLISGKITRFLLISFLIIVAPTQTGAMTVLPVSLQKMSSSAEIIFHGQVIANDTRIDEISGQIATFKGCFAAVRNPLAHEPKILWEGEDDAADYFSFISLLQRKLDDCVPTHLGGAV